jgi:hypothetical protein
MATIGLKGNLLPTDEADYLANLGEMRFTKCISHKGEFSGANTHTRLGWRETQISGMCEDCYDELFKED